jgi:hypothetical protein
MNALRRFFFALAIAMGASLVMVSAQDYGSGPPPGVQSQFEQARTNAMNALSADHRSKVQAIMDQVNNGSLSRQDGASQIDGILTSSESSAVLDQAQMLREAMQQSGGHRGFGGGGGGNHKPDAGRFLLMVSHPPQQ